MKFDLYATVIIDEQAIKPLDYGIPDHLKGDVQEGSRVLIPLRSAKVKGTVLYIRKKTALKSVQPLLEVMMEKQKIPEDLFSLAHWMSKYYATPLRKCLNCILPSPVRDDKEQQRKYLIKRALSKPKTIALCATLREKHPAQAAILEAMIKYDKGIFLCDLLNETKVSQSPIETLIKNKALVKEHMTIDRSLLLSDEYFQTKPKTLNEEQAKILTALELALLKASFETHLLHGITGSGKTELYLQLIQKTLNQGKSVILLVPEIALTAQTIERIKGRFQKEIAILHYRLSDGEKLDTWKNIHAGKIKIVVGARSAVFSPLPNLGLIIIDEEQDNSYKQTDEMPCYNARDVAIVRAKLCNALVLLGSATPSLESYYNALHGKFILHTLKERAGNSQLPKVSIIDMRLDREGSTNHRFFSETLLSQMRLKVAKGEQVILFLNRRGTYSLLKCEKCEHVLQCPHCDQSLTFHRSEHHLSCHLCGYTLTPPPTTCPECKTGETIRFKSPGTDQIERSLNAMFPDIRTLRMDGDTT
ncbi:MAG: primosomal protein N', partial [Simkaniaceae bacterium]|nr:primosomal protein N' [Simkaniaceae bacterium]